MKAKYDLIKMAGWVAVAIGGLAASWATDKGFCYLHNTKHL